MPVAILWRDPACARPLRRPTDEVSHHVFVGILYAGQKDVLHLTEALPNEERGRNVGSTFDHVAFTCMDLAATTGRLQAHGVPYHTDDVPLTGERQLFFSDPAGNGIELNCPKSPGAN